MFMALISINSTQYSKKGQLISKKKRTDKGMTIFKNQYLLTISAIIVFLNKRLGRTLVLSRYSL